MSTYQGKLAEPGVMAIINNNQQKFEPFAETLNSKLVDNQDAHGQIENDETGQPIYRQYTEPTEQSSQVHGSNLTPRDFMIPTDDKTAANIISLNKKQRMVFDALHQWTRNYVKNVSSKKIFKLTRFMYFYLIVEVQGSLIPLKLCIKLYQKNSFIILKNQIKDLFSFWVQQSYLL